MTIASRMSSTAVAAILTLPLALGPAWAQESQPADQSGGGMTQQPDQSQSSGQAQDSTGQQGEQPAGNAAGASGDAGADALVATVGGTEIRGSDVLTVIDMLPPQLQSQPPQMLVPIALDQLIMRELILEQARSENLTEDPEVTAMVTGATQVAEEDALVQVWLDRELGKSVTDEAVQQFYEDMQGQGQQDLPPLADVRPQIEQHLRRQAVEELRTQLRQGTDIVLYDPAGRPITGVEQGSPASGASNQGQTGSESTTSDTSGSNDSASDAAGTTGQAANREAARSQAEQAGMQQVEAVEGTSILKARQPATPMST